MINDNIEITIVEAKNGVCKVAIKADKDVKIYREEIYLQIKLANLIGTNTKIDAVNSVADMIKGGKTLNDNKIDAVKGDDELIVDDKKTKSIKVNKRNNDKS